MTDTIFDHQETSNNADIPTYDQLVGEGKKFKDTEALARGKVESDQFIEQLKREMKELRDDLNSRLNMEELVGKLAKAQQTSSTVTPTSVMTESNPVSPTNVTPTKPAVSPDEIAAIVRNTMSQEHAARSESENVNFVAGKLKQTWGDDWVNKLIKTGDELGLSKTYMDTLAKTAPKALLAIVQAQAPQKVDTERFAAPRSSMIGTPSTQQSNNSLWAKYEKMRRENPREYHSSKVQMEMHRLQAQGKLDLPE